MEEKNINEIDLLDTHNYKGFREAYSQDALEYLYQLGQKDKDFMSMKVGNHIYVNTDKLVRIKPVLPEVPSPYRIFTLQGLVDYIVLDPDQLMDRFSRLVVHVANPRTVFLYSMVYGADDSDERSARAELATCTCTNKPFEFNTEYRREEFMVKLMSLFVQTENAIGVGKVVGNLSMEDAVTTSDDGMSQNVTIKSGIARKANAKVENPVVLAPIRTFPDIEQPESPFVLRIKKEADKAEPRVALYEADGDAWKVTAVRRIHNYLYQALASHINAGKVVVIA